MIRGITETSFLDWDGKIVAVLYTGECNFKCPFCHNWQLMDEPETYPEKDWDEVGDFLVEHRDFLDGVCITGGEPTLDDDLEDIIGRVKDLGLKVKLDTNGSRPEVLKKLIKNDMLDAIAMDVKIPFDERHSKACGVDFPPDKLEESVNIIKNSNLEYEFRTTVVPTIHTKKDIADIAKMLEGADKYVLQQFKPDNTRDEKLRETKPYPNDKILEMATEAKKYVKEVVVRGLR
jgi:pyruvate formate lyase activating enzyme